MYRFGPDSIVGFSNIFHTWLRDVAADSASPLVASHWDMDNAIRHSPLYLVRAMEKILPDCLRR